MRLGTMKFPILVVMSDEHLVGRKNHVVEVLHGIDEFHFELPSPPMPRRKSSHCCWAFARSMGLPI